MNARRVMLLCLALFTFHFSLFTLPAAAADPLAQKVSGSGPVYNSGRQLYLPQGADRKLYATLTLADDWENDPKQAEAASWIQRDPRIANVLRQCNYNFYTLSNPHFRDRLAVKYGTAVPIFTIQRPSGQLLLNVTAVRWPKTSGELADYIDEALEDLYAAPEFQRAADYQTPIERESEGECPPDQPCPLPSPRPPLDGPDGPIMPDYVPDGMDKLLLGAIVAVVTVLGLVAIYVGSQLPPKDSNSVF